MARSDYGSIPSVDEGTDGENGLLTKKEPTDGQQRQEGFGKIAVGAVAFLTVCITVVTLRYRSDARLPENTPRFFEQAVDHFDETNTQTWMERYYAKDDHFGGPGSPIFLVIGGEGPNDVGMFYDFIKDSLAQTFRAFVLHPEHRFYGISQPIEDPSIDQLVQLLTPQQAILDHLTILQAYREKLGCSMDKSSSDWCPCITVGGSYPAFLAAIARLVYPDVVDIGYAASAPLLLYSQEASQFGYYDIVTKSAEQASPGCAVSVKHVLSEIDHAVRTAKDFHSIAEKLSMCKHSIPPYIDNNALFSEEVMQIIADAFADMNMFNYPPSNFTKLAKMCHVFQDKAMNSYERVAEFWKHLEFNIDPTLDCFNMTSQLPDGPNARFSAGDWSGVGPGRTGLMFDFQCCTTLTPAIGFGRDSMFPYRKWTLQWLTDHCQRRFHLTPRPTELVELWKFNDLVGQNASRILFTNGMNDMWSAGSYLTNLSDSILAVNIPGAAHHSELSFTNEENRDTEDVKWAHNQIERILGGWLNEIREAETN